MELVLSSAPLLVLGSILVSVQFISSYYKQIRSNRSFIWPESLGIQPWIILLCYTDHWGKNWTNQGNKLHGHSEVWAFEGRLPLLFSGMCCGKFLCSVWGEGAGLGWLQMQSFSVLRYLLRFQAWCEGAKQPPLLPFSKMFCQLQRNPRSKSVEAQLQIKSVSKQKNNTKKNPKPPPNPNNNNKNLNKRWIKPN